MQEQKHKAALSIFVEAHKIFIKNIEIIFYKSSAMITLFLASSQHSLNLDINKEYFDTIIKEYDKGIRLHRFDHFLHFHRGLLHLYVHNFDQAIFDFQQAIKNNDLSEPKYYLYMGLAYGCVNLLEESIKHLTTAINLKDNYLPAYYNRGKCAYLIGNIDLAFSDFQKLVIIKPVCFF